MGRVGKKWPSPQAFPCSGKRHVCLDFKMITILPLQLAVMAFSSSEIKVIGGQFRLKGSSNSSLLDLQKHVLLESKSSLPVALKCSSYVTYTAKPRISGKGSILLALQFHSESTNAKWEITEREWMSCPDPRQTTWEAQQYIWMNRYKHPTVPQNTQLLPLIFSCTVAQ